MKDVAKQIVQQIVQSITAKTTKGVRKDLCGKWEAIINKELDNYEVRKTDEIKSSKIT